MKAILVVLAVLIACLCLAQAAPAQDGPQVHVLRYKNDADFEAIQRQIIAQYEQLGGSSQVHPVQTATAVDPHTLKIQI